MRFAESHVPDIHDPDELDTRMVPRVDGHVVEIKKRASHHCDTRPTFENSQNTLDMRENSPPENIEIPESVNREADRLENNPELMLRLVDLIFFLDDRDPIPS
jgi:hypothetical protein